MSNVRVLLISGSTRGASTNTALLRTAEAIAPPGISASLFAGMTDLPHFNPDDDPDDDSQPLPAAVVAMRTAMRAADAVLISTPEYAGALPGSFKNLLDWCVGGGELYGKPAGWINVSSSGTGAADAYASLAKVLRYLSVDVVADACAHVPVLRSQVSGDGTIADPRIRRRIVDVLHALVRHDRTGAHQDEQTSSSGV